MLYIVPTPIGCLEDITLRALRVLKEVDLIAAEDTRHSGKLLAHYEISKPLVSLHRDNEHAQTPRIIQRMIQDNLKVAVVTDAGTPGISDPGFLIVREAIAQGVTVETLPGATAFVPALVNSGLPCDRFVFEGFLPPKKGRQTRIQLLSEEDRTVVLYEAPHRLLKTLEQLAPFFGEDRPLCVCRELTKLHEETFRGTIAEALRHFSDSTIKGEIVIVIGGK